MADDSLKMRKEIEAFKQSTAKLSDKINAAGDLWRDSSYSTLKVQIGELAKNSRTVVEGGERVSSSTDRFFAIAAEDV